jgi:hypothetical protein
MYTAVLLSACPVVAQSPWNGTWELDKATLHLLPPALSVEVSGAHYTLKRDATYRFDCDGRDFPGPDSRSVRCERLPHGIKVELKRDGKLSSTWQLEVHMDGVTMTDIVTDFREGVQPAIEHDEYRRPAPRNGELAGVWTGVRTEIEGSDALEFRIHDGFLYFRDGRDGESSEAKLDGTPAKFLGPGSHPEITWSNVLENERRIIGHALKDGKQLNTEVFELSSDGKSIKAYQPGSPEHFQAIYVKQK